MKFKCFLSLLLYVLLTSSQIKAENATDVRTYLISLGVSDQSLDNYIEELTDSTYSIKQGEQMLSIDSMIQNRTIALSGPINDEKAIVIQSLLLYFDTIASAPITLIINSPGGSVYAGLGIYDTMSYISSSVHTKCVGLAASMAAVILSAGEKGGRSAIPSSQIMIHRPKKAIDNNNVDCVDELEKLENEIFSIIAENTMKSYDIIQLDCSSDFWLSAEEAKEYGLIDEISY